MAKSTTTTTTARKLFRASVWTDHFTFEAYGATAKEARAALVEGFKAHAVQYGLPGNWHRAFHPTCEGFAIGKAYRDRSLIAGGE